VAEAIHSHFKPCCALAAAGAVQPSNVCSTQQ
jgi:hypothetical protein